MVGLLLWKEERGKKRERTVTVRERSILHVRFQCAEILRTEKTPEVVLRRRVSAAVKRLRKLGVSRVVLPRNFACWRELEREGLQPVSTLPLRRALAADWMGWLLSRQGATPAGSRVAVAADKLTGEVVHTVTELALRHRYILLDLAYGGEELCRQLRREYGVSPLLNPTARQIEEAEALVLFDPRRDCRCPVTLHLYEERDPLPPLALPPALEERLPLGADRGQLVSVLWESGAIRAGQIAVGSTNLTKKGPFLADSPP